MLTILLKNCLVIDDNHNTTVQKDILIEGKKIKEMSEKTDNKDNVSQVIDIKGKYVFPGIIDCHTHLGIIEEATGKIGIDNNETSDPVTPHLRGIDAINPFDISFHDAVKSGVTTVMSGPGSNNAVGGLSAAIKTHGSIIDHMIVRNPIGLKIALGENPISTYGTQNKAPVTRMGTVSLIRDLFMRTQDYIYLKEQSNLKQRDIKLEAVIPVLKGEISLRVHAHRADDIITAVRIAEEFNIQKLVIEHGTEANLVKEYLKEKNIPVAYGPMLTPRIKMEMKRRHYSAVVDLMEAGVKAALITDHPYNSIDQLRTIAAIAISEGLSQSDAIKSITRYPAEILECEDRIGKLEEGYDADLVVYDGKPLNINTKVLMTIINGEIIYRRTDS
ncbi:amidohydrolase [Petroclostridium sp. X23]|uniref:amidohydrolase n=1 Tax=Petroclostridium sp. X23 TaxID=3045146 RepID=UPI0024AE1A60|nr:amidohydrolase [Petroclostridium sp. X23]WHH60543.1 amidohydrolase [Petroclostridium sp. X23]